MKVLLSSVLLYVVANFTFSQQAIRKGNLILDPYIGLPQRNAFQEAPSIAMNYRKNGGFIAYGGRLQYMIKNKLGIGIDLNYRVSGENYDYWKTTSIYDYETETSTQETSIENYDYVSKKLRYMLRINQYVVNNEKLNLYFGFGGGPVRDVQVSSGPDPTLSPQNMFSPIGGSVDFKKASPIVAIRFSMGGQVYFTNNFGLMFEGGIGGGTFLQFGTSLKI
jgi:hypothetical protein